MQPAPPLPDSFFQRPPHHLAVALLGKVLFRRIDDLWLACQIVETEAYFVDEKASHSSLGRTPSREAMFMPAGTLYLYYSRGKPTLNISTEGDGNAVLVKAGIPWRPTPAMIKVMEAALERPKPVEKLCAGQTLLARALYLQVEPWRGRRFDPQQFFLADVGYRPEKIVQTTRLGIAPHRDAHLPYRFVDAAHVRSATRNPMTRQKVAGVDYHLLSYEQAIRLERAH